MSQRHMKHTKLSNFSACGGYARKKTKWIKDISCKNCHRTHTYRGFIQSQNKSEKQKPKHEIQFRHWMRDNVFEKGLFSCAKIRFNMKTKMFILWEVKNAAGEIIADHIHINISRKAVGYIYDHREFFGCVIPYVNRKGYTSHTIKYLGRKSEESAYEL